MIRISQIAAGDKILATNTKTGKSQAEPVTAGPGPPRHRPLIPVLVPLSALRLDSGKTTQTGYASQDAGWPVGRVGI
jgi:hypothetical protein